MVLHCLDVHTPNKSVDGTCEGVKHKTQQGGDADLPREVIVQAMITQKVMANNTANKQTNKMFQK